MFRLVQNEYQEIEDLCKHRDDLTAKSEEQEPPGKEGEESPEPAEVDHPSDPEEDQPSGPQQPTTIMATVEINGFVCKKLRTKKVVPKTAEQVL